MKPGQEVEHRLLARQPRDRREDPEGVCGQEDDGARVAGPLGRERVRDLLELVGGSRVLRLRVVVQVEHAALVHDHVLEHRAPATRGLVDLRLGLGREADHLRVAAALDVEDPLLAPAVLVVADQVPLWIGRERRLAGPGEPEEDRDAAVVVDVGRAVHRQDAFEGQAVVHEREDRLLDLAGVEGAADEHLHPARVENDEGLAPGPILFGIGRDLGRVQDERLRLVVGELLLGRIDEERLREERMPGAVGHTRRARAGALRRLPANASTT